MYVSHVVRVRRPRSWRTSVTIASSVAFWLSRTVDLTSATFLGEGPASKEEEAWINITVAFSVGYFANDTMLILCHKIGGLEMIFHHVLIGGLFLHGLLFKCCTTYHFLVLIEELSTPFLNLRWQYRRQTSTLTYQVSQAIFGILFFSIRIIFGTGQLFLGGIPHMLSPYVSALPPWRKVCVLTQVFGLYFARGLNLFWFWKIIATIRRGRTLKDHVDESVDEDQVKERLKAT